MGEIQSKSSISEEYMDFLDKNFQTKNFKESISLGYFYSGCKTLRTLGDVKQYIKEKKRIESIRDNKRLPKSLQIKYDLMKKYYFLIRY